MIPTKYLVIVIIIGVAVAYYFVGEVALGGLLALGLGLKGKKKQANEAVTRAELREDNSDQRFDESTEYHEDAVNSHNEAHEAADVTKPNYDLPDGFTPRNTSSK